MRARLLKRSEDLELSRDRVREVAKDNNAILVGPDEVTLNDDLCHPVIIYTQDGKPIVGVMIKDLEDDSDKPIIIERNFCSAFIEKFRDAFIKARVMGQELDNIK